MIMPSGAKNQSEQQLTETESSSTAPSQDRRGTNLNSNDQYDIRGHKSSDRKTGLAQTDDHFSWRQVYRALEVRVFGHDDERKP